MLAPSNAGEQFAPKAFFHTHSFPDDAVLTGRFARRKFSQGSAELFLYAFMLMKKTKDFITVVNSNVSKSATQKATQGVPRKGLGHE